MVKTDYYGTRDDGVKLYRTYSDNNMMIRKDGTGELYAEAIDVENSGYTYTETDIPIERESEDEKTDIEQKAEAFDYLTGRANGE